MGLPRELVSVWLSAGTEGQASLAGVNGINLKQTPRVGVHSDSQL